MNLSLATMDAAVALTCQRHKGSGESYRVNRGETKLLLFAMSEPGQYGRAVR
jgi:hypothetical protein